MSRAPRPLMPLNTKTRRSRHLMLVGAVASIVLSLASGFAEAATAISVYSDQARILPIKGEPAIVIVGNPLFADASIRPGLIVINGRHFGTTNVLVLDGSGNEIANFEVTVVRNAAQSVTIYQTGGSVSYACSPNCESALEVGDAPEHFKQIQEDITSRMGLSESAAKLAKQ